MTEKEDISSVQKPEVNQAPRVFEFSSPNIIYSPEKAINFGVTSKHVYSPNTSQGSIFQFSPPTNLSKHQHEIQDLAKKYKPRIFRNTFKPPINVFTQALKGTPAFEQLKKNSKTQTQKHSYENSITCVGVPKCLLDRAVAKEYFSMFGDISKIILYRKKQMITVFYVTKGEANIAYYKAGVFLNEKFDVRWSHDIPKSPIRRNEISTSVVSRILKGSNNEVQEEVEALKNLEYNLHGESCRTVDSPIFVKFPKAPKTKEMMHEKIPMRSEKVLSMKAEKAEVENQFVTSFPKATIEELQNIIRQAASSSEEKYKILEARDKLMRQRQVKSLSLVTAKATKGTCPDMCPEKERLMREAQRQVSFYEQLDNSGSKINHMTAIKQYSRSSADQEEPLPHELRPVCSLKMTMSYLLHEIVDFCDNKDTNLAEWYHFLWDRTRGIRKDITQQELCCVDSVELIEQCARFHILCSERLCAEESSVFDKKINTENLTKCLQTLKYMYHDLRVKGITCRNEPEFRAYIILLNLNNSSFMWDLQKLPSSIQKSLEVKFAIEVYSAIVSSNYVKFFKLVRKTTYLNACILLRYFNQVRVTALSIMVKAYCRTTSKPYLYPLYELIDILAFEEEKEATFFCEQVGLSLAKDELHILLGRENFSLPESNIVQSRAFNIVEFKRRGEKLSAGQCIAGRSLPEKTYEHHQPHDSFNSQGYLLTDSLGAEDQKISTGKKKELYEYLEGKESNKSVRNTEAELESRGGNISSSSSVIFPRVIESNNGMNSQTSDTFEFDVEKSTVFTMIHSNDALKIKPDELKTTASSIFTMPSKQPVVSCAHLKQSIFSGTSSENILLKPETNTSLTLSMQAKSNFMSSDLMVKVKEDHDMEKYEILENNQNTPQTEKERNEKVECEKRLKEIEWESERVFSSLLAVVAGNICSSILKEEIYIIKCEVSSEDIFRNLLQDIVQETCENELNEQLFLQKMLQEVREREKKKITAKYCKIWKGYVHRNRAQREALDNTPIWLQRQSLENCAKSLYDKQQYVAVKNMCRKRFKSSVNVLQERREVPVEIVVYGGIKENARSFDAETQPSIFWKMAISWPNLENRVVLRQRKKIITKYLNPEDLTTDPILKTFQPNNYETLHICIRNFQGVTSERSLTGIDALLFVASTSEDKRTILRRLTKTILSKNKLMPIPLVIIIFHDGNIKPETVDIVSDLEHLMDSGFISEYTIVSENSIDECIILKLIQSAILWLAINKSPPVPLEMNYLQKVLRDCLMEELWFRIHGHSLYNAKLTEALKNPQFIINLHAEAITHLMEIMLDPESLMYTDFSPEMKQCLNLSAGLPSSYEFFDNAWKNVEYREKVEKHIRSLILPQWRYPWPIEDRAELQRAVSSYIQETSIDSRYNVMENDVLANIFPMTDTNRINPSFIAIMLPIINEKINFIKEDLKVVYNKNHVKHFRTLPWWFKSNVFSHYNLLHPLIWETQEGCKNNESSNSNATTLKMDIDENDVDAEINDENFEESLSTTENFTPLTRFFNNKESQMMEIHSSLKIFEAQLEKQKLKVYRLEDELRKELL